MATTRKPKFTETAQAAAQVIDVESVPVGDADKPLLARIDEWLEQKVGIPHVASWQRVLSGWVLALAASSGLGYLVIQLAGYMMIGAIAMTGGMFLPIVILCLALVLGYWAGDKVGRFVWRGVVLRDWGWGFSVGTPAPFGV